MICLVDERISEKCERSLLKQGFRIIKMPNSDNLGPAVAAHPDMLLFYHHGNLITSSEYCDKVPYIFSDIKNHWAESSIIKMVEKGIVNGVTENEFMPDENVTREQMAAIIARFAQYKGIEVTKDDDVVYADNDNVSNYAKEAVKITKLLGILEGNEDGSFAPKRNASRAEAAAVFVRLLDIMQ